jgi:phage terminase small subunit
VIQGDRGLVQSPHLKRARVARDQLVKIGREFGITPAAETGVKAGPASREREAAARRSKFRVLGAAGSNA